MSPLVVYVTFSVVEVIVGLPDGEVIVSFGTTVTG
jgi:hypothetical protein